MTWLISLFLASSISTTALPISVPLDDHTGQMVSARVNVDESVKTEKSYPINPDGRVSVNNINGSIKVVGWDRPEVKLATNKVSNVRERLDDIEIRVSSSPGRFDVEVDYKKKRNSWKRGDKLYVNFSLMVPKTAYIDEIESVNGSINVSDLNNYISVSAVNGGIRASRLQGKMKLSTVNGSVSAVLNDVESTSDVSLSTVNGTADVTLPSNVSATIKADTVNGSIKNDFGLPVKVGKYIGRDLYGQIGSGTTRIRLNSVNGSIRILRLEDGLEMNPVKNLLPRKTSDDFDDSFDNDLRSAREQSRRVAVIASNAARVAVEAVVVGGVETETDLTVNTEAIEKALQKALKKVEQIDAEEIRREVEQSEKLKNQQRGLESEIERVTRTAVGNRGLPFIVEDSKTVDVVGKQLIDVTAPGCNITVKGWDQNKVGYTITRLARGRESAVKHIGFSNDKSNVRLGVWLAQKPLKTQVLDQVSIEVRVPKKSNLKINTDREIRLEGVSGEVNLQGKNGGINVRDSAGSLNVYSKTGVVRVIGYEGTLDSNSGTGDVYLEGDFARIDSFSKSGSVFLSVPRHDSATIRTNSLAVLGIQGKNTSPNKTMSIDGLVLKNIADGVWKVGNGSANYDFKFSRGRLVLRVLDSAGSGD
jgi:hypothetical protein